MAGVALTAFLECLTGALPGIVARIDEDAVISSRGVPHAWFETRLYASRDVASVVLLQSLC